MISFELIDRIQDIVSIPIALWIIYRLETIYRVGVKGK